MPTEAYRKYRLYIKTASSLKDGWYWNPVGCEEGSEEQALGWLTLYPNKGSEFRVVCEIFWGSTETVVSTGTVA